jgi:aminopeptidase N
MARSVRRLYKELKPNSYVLRLEPDTAAMTFTGNVTVRLKKTGRPSQRLTFHQHGLTVESARIIRSDKKGRRELPVARINNQNSLDEVRLHTNEMVYSGEYEIHMTFRGRITRGMTGLYPCFFTVDGTEHVLLATQFESHHAREVFPCIDEPEAKATFQLSIVASKDQVVLSNTPVETQTKADNPQAVASGKPHDPRATGNLLTTFQPTPKMSTYLLAFVIGELHRKSANTKRGTEVSVWATTAQPAGALDFALDAAVRSIEFFEAYFGVDYPLAKADHIALPDFSSGAMENWGLITYRERVLLAYPGETAQSTKEQIATVIAHETSHQWFGNLVTMRWWNDLWLNESFANLMEYQAVDALFPEWHIWDEFVAGEGLSALRRDATAGVQAIQTNVHHPDEINTLFDPSIVYAKGGRLLYMLKTYLGEEAFRKGLSAYFAKHAYGNTTGSDLWQALQAASGVDVAAFMDPWLERSGFPVVTVDQDGRTLNLRQTHFLESGEQSDGRIWPVPLFSGRAELPDVLQKAELRIKLASDEPLRIDQGAAGHYIVRYARPEHRAHLASLVEQGALNAPERLMLLNNASMLSKAGQEPFADVLRLLEAYTGEDNEAVWGALALIIAEVRRFVDLDANLEEPIKTLVRRLIRKQYERLGWEEKDSESSSDRKLRATVIALGAYADDPEIVAGSLERFRAYKQDPATVDAELRGIIFGVPVRNKAEDAFKFLLELHDQTANGELKADATGALTGTKDAGEADALLARLTDANLVKPQDADHWLAYLLRNRYVREPAWEWMTGHWQWVEETYAHDKSYDYFPRYAAAACNTRAWAGKYAAFFGPKQDQLALKRNIAIALSEIETRVKWLERDLGSVQKFFKG